MPIFFLTSSEDIIRTDLLGGLLDSMTIFPLAIIVMLNMLQDRQRPLWPIALMIAPFVVGGVFSVATLSYALIPMLYVYLLLLSVCILIYMVRATRQYGRWLRDNYADLEHKEVWQSFVVLAIILLVFVIYAYTSKGPSYQYAMQVIIVVLICYLSWHVETLSELSLPINDMAEEMVTTKNVEDNGLSLSIRNNIGPLLKQHCEEPQLYLQHDISVTQLAMLIGTNRVYLSQYFSSQDINYNTYINNLRIQHFIRLYRKAVTAQQPFTAQQLAIESGFHIYRTFSNAFKQQTGQTVTNWMKGKADGKAQQGQDAS